MDFMTFFESICLIIFRNVLFEDRIDKYFKIFIPLSMFLTILNKYILSYNKGSAIIIIIAIIIIALTIVSKKNIIIVISELLIASIIVILCELVAQIITILELNVINAEYITILIINIFICWIMFYFILKNVNIKNRLDILIKLRNNTSTIGILINAFIIFLLLKTLYDNGVLNNRLLLEITVYVIIFIMISINIYMNAVKNIDENDKLKLENSFKTIIEDYTQKLRASDHEYKNHLNTIYSMINVCNENNMKEEVNKYICNLTNSDYLNKLLYVDNIIVKSILYSKMTLANSEGMQVKYNIKSNLKYIKLNDMDLVVVLNNLLNNAIEENKEVINSFIEINIEEYIESFETIYSIKVTNSVKDIKSLMVDKIVQKGFSTKNGDRGYGLYNVKKIVNKVNGSLIIETNSDSISIEILV